MLQKYSEQDFFIADELEIISFRNEISNMEHPFFALRGGDVSVKKYKNGNITITIRPAAEIGLATVFDKDIWIYVISKLQQAIFNKQSISQTVVFTPYDFFMTTNRDKGGRSYEELKKSLSRLSGTRIQHNIKRSENENKITDFGLIDKWGILEKKKGNLDMGMIEITLPDWLYQGITKNYVLKISPDYFLIRKAIDRRLYEIARKHCGYQEFFNISLELLHLKTGSSSSKEKFKYNIKKLSIKNNLPDYNIIYCSHNNNIIFKNKNFNFKSKRSIKKIVE